MLLDTILSLFFGTKHERDVKSLQPIVERINSLEPDIKKLSNIEIAAKIPWPDRKRRVSGQHST
jgi:preprotein translocase subunit SecA